MHTKHREWTRELESVILKLQEYMEAACDQYFEEIKPLAIEVHEKNIITPLNSIVESTFDREYFISQVEF